MDESLSILIYGHAKAGKTYFADTAPAPRLILDAEGGIRFTPSKKTVWDPATQQPPDSDGTWETCVVYVRNYATLQQAYQWLNVGPHPFRSVIIDSISEAQQRCIDGLVGTAQMQTQDWGQLLREVSTLIRQYRDLTIHPTNPLNAVILTAMAIERNGRWMPYMQGQVSVRLPYYTDVVAYLWAEQIEGNGLVRHMLTQPHTLFDAGDRTGRLGGVIDNPSVPEILARVFNTEG